MSLIRFVQKSDGQIFKEEQHRVLQEVKNFATLQKNFLPFVIKFDDIVKLFASVNGPSLGKSVLLHLQEQNSSKSVAKQTYNQPW